MRPRRVKCKPGRIHVTSKGISLPESTGGRIHFQQVNSLPMTNRTFRPLGRAVGADVG